MSDFYAICKAVFVVWLSKASACCRALPSRQAIERCRWNIDGKTKHRRFRAYKNSRLAYYIPFFQAHGGVYPRPKVAHERWHFCRGTTMRGVILNLRLDCVLAPPCRLNAVCIRDCYHKF